MLTDNLYNYVLAHTPESQVCLCHPACMHACILQLCHAVWWSVASSFAHNTAQTVALAVKEPCRLASLRLRLRRVPVQVLGRLREATAEQHAGRERNQVAPEQGRFLAWLVEALGVRSAIEIGVFTGYSSLAIALVRTCCSLSPHLPHTKLCNTLCTCSAYVLLQREIQYI